MNDLGNFTDQGGVCVDRYGKAAGKGALVKWEHAPCIAAAQDTTLFVFSPSSTLWAARPERTIRRGGVCPSLTRGRASVSDVHAVVMKRENDE